MKHLWKRMLSALLLLALVLSLLPGLPMKAEAGGIIPGQLATVDAGQELTIEVTLDEKPRTTEEPAAEAVPDQSQMPQDGSFEEWFDYFDRFYNFGR